jgi:hypothetical protein
MILRRRGELLADGSKPLTGDLSVNPGKKIDGVDISEEKKLRINIYSTGICCGGILSINGLDNTKFDISEGDGKIIDNYTDTDNPTESIVSWNNKIAILVTYISTSNISYIGIDNLGNVVQQINPFTQTQLRDIIYLGTVIHPNRITIDYVTTQPLITYDISVSMYDFINLFGSLNIEGNYYSPNGINLKSNKSAGKTYSVGSNYSISKKEPNTKIDNAQTALSFSYLHKNGTGDWIISSLSTDIDPDHYDNNNITLGIVPPNKWTVQTIFYSTELGTTFIQYGQVIYDTEEAAQSNLAKTISISPLIEKYSFRGWIIIKQGSINLSDSLQAVFVNASRFGFITIMAGGIEGEVNTASNLGVTTYGLYKSKSGVDLQFKSLTESSSKIKLTNNTNDVGIDVDETEIPHNNLKDLNVGDYKHLTATEKTNTDTAITNTHTHSNKTILDLISEAFTTALKAIYDGVVSAFNSHKDATTGIHGVGVGTIAKVGDIATDSNLSVAAQDAIAKKHSQNTDTALGALAADINMNTHQVTALSVPDSNGEAIRQTTKITEVNLEDSVDKKHTESTQFNQSISGEIAGLTEKITPASTDVILIESLSDSNAKRKLQVGNLPVKYGDYYYAESLGESNTTSSYPTFINKLTYNLTPNAGVYILEWNFEMSVSAAGLDIQYKVWNGTDVYSSARNSIGISYANSGWVIYSGFIKLTLTQINMNFYIDFCRQATGTAYIKNAKILLRRIA